MSNARGDLMVKVSVVMPVYNTKRFLKDSINSILNQTLSDLELICVDDGSDDGSLDILYEFAEKDDRVSVFSLNHQGAGNARNFALKYTTGEFLYFMDSDDFLDLNAFEDFCNICESKNLDFMLFKMINYDVDEDHYYETDYYNMPKISSFVKDKVFNFKDLGDLIFNINSSTCSKFYNRDFVIRSGAKFRENSKFNDNQFFWDVIFSAERIYFLDKHYYTRTRHSSSLTGSKDKKHIDTIGVFNDIIELFIKHGQLDKFKNKLYNNKTTVTLQRFEEIHDDFKELFYIEIKKDFQNFENTDFRKVLWSSNRFIYDSFLVSKNLEDFNLLKKFYYIIKNNECSYDDKVSYIKKWFNSLETTYKQHFFDAVKFWIKKYHEDNLCIENKRFYEKLINSSNYQDYHSVKVSVVMPVYNTKRFLKDSINSILNQTLSDLELICVDDGSDDGSLDILYEFAEKDDRVSVFSLNHQGAGNARNFALKYTTGEFLYFMDSDDFLDLNAFEDFCNICESKNLDFMLFKMINYDVDEDHYYETDYYNMPKISSFVKDKVFNFKDLGDLIFNINSSTCSKFYNRDFVIRSGAKFRENSKFNDNQFFWDVIFSAERIYFLDKHYYTRTRHSSSLTGSKDKKHIDTIGVFNDIIELFIKHGQLDKFKNKLYNNKIHMAFTRYNEVNDEFKELFYQEMKKDFITFKDNFEFISVLRDELKFIFESVIISKNFKDFNLIVKYYSIISDNNSSKNHIVSSTEAWFNSLDENYQHYFFAQVKSKFKNIPESNLNSENLIFYNIINSSSSYDEYIVTLKEYKINNLLNQLENKNSILKNFYSNETSDFLEIKHLLKDISEIQRTLKLEIDLIFNNSKFYGKKLEKSMFLLNEKNDLISTLLDECDGKDNDIDKLTNKIINYRSIVVEKESLIMNLTQEINNNKDIISNNENIISELNDKLTNYRALVVEKEGLITDLGDEINVYKSNIVKKEGLITDLGDEINVYKSNIVDKKDSISDLQFTLNNIKSMIKRNSIELSKLKSENSYLIKKNESLNLKLIEKNNKK